MGAALRWEDFSDFGSTTNFKVTSLYKLGDALRLRGSISTGFRAPTPGQQQVVNVSTVFETVNGRLQLAQRGTIPPTNPVAAEFGADPLGPEKADSFTLGFVADIGDASLTVDYFNIKLSDRITQSATISLSQADRDALVASGIAFAADLQAFRFFVNDFDTRSQGVDVVATLPLNFSDDGSTALSFAGNYTKTEVIDFNPATLDACRIQRLEDSLPAYRFSSTLTHNASKWRFLARANYHGKYFSAHADSCDLPIDGKAEITMDAEIGYNVMEGFEISIGAENLFDNSPTLNPWSGEVGSKYSEHAPFGVNGGAYYVRARYQF